MSWLSDALDSVKDTVQTAVGVAAEALPVVSSYFGVPTPAPAPVSPTVSPMPTTTAPQYQMPIASGVGPTGGAGGAGVVPQTSSFFQRNQLWILGGGAAVVILGIFFMMRK